VVLAVADSSSGTHALHIAHADHGACPRAVFVRQGAFEHVGDDLHVPVRMSREPAAGNNSVFVDDSQITKAHVVRIMIIPEREGMAAIEPTGLCFTSFSCPSYSNHFIPLLISPLRKTLKTALMSQSQDSSKTYLLLIGVRARQSGG